MQIGDHASGLDPRFTMFLNLCSKSPLDNWQEKSTLRLTAEEKINLIRTWRNWGLPKEISMSRRNLRERIAHLGQNGERVHEAVVDSQSPFVTAGPLRADRSNARP
jgi:hypothetical protein